MPDVAAAAPPAVAAWNWTVAWLGTLTLPVAQSPQDCFCRGTQLPPFTRALTLAGEPLTLTWIHHALPLTFVNAG